MVFHRESVSFTISDLESICYKYEFKSSRIGMEGGEKILEARTYQYIYSDPPYSIRNRTIEIPTVVSNLKT